MICIQGWRIGFHFLWEESKNLWICFKTITICPLATNYLHSSHMQNTLKLSQDPPRVSFFADPGSGLSSILIGPIDEALQSWFFDYSCSRSATLELNTCKLKRQVFCPNSLNICWWERHRITTSRQQGKGEMYRNHWSAAILKSSQVYVLHFLIRSQSCCLGVILYGSLPFPLSSVIFPVS